MPRKRKRRSWGSITTVTKTKHVIRWMENTPEGRKRRSRTFCGTYKEACFELSRLQVEHSDDRPVPTIGDACRMWYLPWLERRIAERKTKARTGEIYTKCWERIIEPRWGSTPMDSVVPSDVQKWLLGLTAGNAEIALVVLRKIADFAVQYDVIDSNKFRLPYEIPAEKARGKRTGTYTLREATDLFEALRDHLTEASYILACFGSARTGESLGVRPAEVSLVESHGISFAIAPISRRMDETGDLPLPDGDLKNPQSERTLVIPEPYGTRLFEIAAMRISDGVEWLADRGDGLPFNRGTLKYAWEKDAGADAIPFANLRTSWRTFAQYEWGVDFDTLEILMGHLVPGVTGKHYLKPKIDDLVNAVAKAVVQSRAS